LARKKILVYHLEKLQREENGDQITIMFDCEKGSLRNFDLELIQFFIQVMLQYYPHMVHIILVFEMPWVLNAGWKIIKPLLPGPAVKKIKFVTRSNLSDHVSPENQLAAWGGLDPWTYIWEPEAKKVNLLEASDQDLDNNVMVITPEKFLVFERNEDTLEASIQISNISSQEIVYKVKTTSPEIFRVQPHTAIVPPNETKIVRIFVSTTRGPRNIQNEKFQILGTKVTTTDTSAREAFLKGDIYQEARLYCSVSPPVKDNNLIPIQHEIQHFKQILQNLDKVDNGLSRCQSSLNLNKMLSYVIFCIYAYILYVLMYK